MLKINKLLWITALFTTAMITLALIGGYKSYSPVPFWDMWNGTLDFFMRIKAGDLYSWWTQHNEHRIVLARLLFWIDNQYFSGLNYFLIIVNYLFIAVGAYVFWCLLRISSATKKADREQMLIGLFITAWLFQWMQSENFTWGFQSQFFLAQLLPLCAFYWLHKSTLTDHSRRAFFIATIFGLASVGTMANGILALPLMTAYALIIRQKPLRIGMLAILSWITLYGYFHWMPLKNSSLCHDLLTQPMHVLYFILLYLGNPFYYLCGRTALGHICAVTAAVFFIGCALYATFQTFRQKSINHLNVTLLTFILFIGATALATTGGRMDYGFDQALLSRYTTPVLMAWAALLLLYAPALTAALKTPRKKIVIPCAIIAGLMLSQQLSAVHSKPKVLFKKNVAALALALGVDDPTQISAIYPVAKNVLPTAAKAVAQNLSIFGAYPLHDAKARLGTTLKVEPHLITCQSQLDNIKPIDSRFSKISGHLANPQKPQTFILLLNKQNKIIGYAYIDSLSANFQGYIVNNVLNTEIYLQTENDRCQLMIKSLKKVIHAS